MNESQMPLPTSETTTVANEPSPSIEETTSMSPGSKSATPATPIPSTGKSLTRPKSGGSAAAAKALGEFERAVGGRQAIAAKIANNTLTVEQETFVALLLDPGREGDSIGTLACDSGVGLHEVLRLYRGGAEAEARAIATAAIADATPGVTREILARARETQTVCPCLRSGKADPKCKRCSGTGLWLREGSLPHQQMVWKNLGLLKDGGGINISQNTAVGVVSAGGFMDKFVKSSDAIAYDVRPSDIIEGDIEHE